ncbi:MAG: PepSY domain-containing protein [Caulobacterales bacterium]|nr:PepSY domain-containing protein [Caulobacterales bacterium]
MSARLNRVSVWLHKWIGLIVAAQIAFWVIGGLVMVALPIERVRGEHRLSEIPAVQLDMGQTRPLAEVATEAGVFPARAELSMTPRGPVWTLSPVEGEPVRLSARTGRPLTPYDAAEAQRLASEQYQGPGEAQSAELLAEAPVETGREGPLWRVEFDDPEGTRFYLDTATGAVVSRRSQMWSLFDVMWRLHILDFGPGGDNINSWWLILLAAVSVIVVVTGLILLVLRLGRDLARARSSRKDA